MCLEVNPRASRTVPFVSKAIGVPLAKLAAKVMAGKTLKELGFTREICPQYWAVKESVFPFSRFHGQDILLSPEMRSTGEVMGLDADLGIAYAKSQMAAGASLPLSGRVFISVSNATRRKWRPWPRQFAELGFELVATSGTAAVLEKAGLESAAHFQTAGGPSERDRPPQEPGNPARHQHARRPDAARRRNQNPHNGRLHRHAHHDDLERRQAAALGIAALKKAGYGVRTVQEYH